MLQDKLKLNEVAEKCGFKTAAEAFHRLKIENGNLWATIMLQQIKENRRVFSNLNSMYRNHLISYGSHGKWALYDHRQNETSRIVFMCDDIFPHDGSLGFVRYYKITETEEGPKEQEYKMKIGKAVRASLKGMRADLCEKAITYICERTTSEWLAKQQTENDYHLRVDDDFEFIYNSENYAGHISSCQQNANNYNFYRLIKGAKAASLCDEDGKVLARAILFTEIHHRECDDAPIKGIERMYSVDNRLDFKQIFLQKLIADKQIDIYKDFNAGAYDGNSWLTIAQEEHRDSMYVELVRPLEDEDPVSWMDSFYLTDGKTICANYDFGEYEIRNSNNNVTWGTFFGCWDEYLEEYVSGYDDDDRIRVILDGNEIYVAPSTQERYFCWCKDEDEYYHEDDCEYSDRDDCYYHNAVYSEYYNSYILNEDTTCITRPNGDNDVVYSDDCDIVELEDGGYMMDDELYIEQNGIRYRAVEA